MKASPFGTLAERATIVSDAWAVSSDSSHRVVVLSG